MDEDERVDRENRLFSRFAALFREHKVFRSSASGLREYLELGGKDYAGPALFEAVRELRGRLERFGIFIEFCRADVFRGRRERELSST